MTQQLAGRLGLDHNPLRRRADRIAACLMASLLAAFLIGTPLLSVAAVGWASRTAAADQRAQRSWHQVSAVLLQDAALPFATGEGYVDLSWTRARWAVPDGHTRTGKIPVSVGLAAGDVVSLWVNAAGSPVKPPLGHHGVLVREATAAAATVLALAIVLSCVAGAGQWMLNRRRLAGWEAEWATTGPQWTKRFPSCG